MSSPRKQSSPDLSADCQQYKDAMADKDHLYSGFNVEDRFKDKSQEEIRETLRKTAFPFAVCFEQWIGSFTVSSGMRNANAFNAKEIFYIGIKHLDKRGMCGCYHYNPIQWLPTLDDLIALKTRYTFVGVDNMPNAIPLPKFTWPDNALMIFGSEGVGLTPTVQKLCDSIVYIEQFGSVRSLNAAVASGICAYDYTTKYRSKQ